MRIIIDLLPRFLDSALMQLNVEISESDAKRVKKDAIEHGVTLSEYAAQAFGLFLSKPIASRRVYFNGKSKKVMGRKIRL